ncbi:ferritin-like domain-containing protein [Thermococcus sp.]
MIEILNEIRKLDERELLSYWIEGEYEEARVYSQLADRAEELGLPKEVVDTFRRLSEESKGHGDDLYVVYREKYGKELVKVDIPNVETTHVVGRFWMVEDIEDVLRNALDAEKLAETIYRKLAEEAQGELGELYLELAEEEFGHYKALLEVAKALGLEIEGKEKEECEKT